MINRVEKVPRVVLNPDRDARPSPQDDSRKGKQGKDSTFKDVLNDAQSSAKSIDKEKQGESNPNLPIQKSEMSTAQWLEIREMMAKFRKK